MSGALPKKGQQIPAESTSSNLTSSNSRRQYASTDSVMLRRAIQSALRNYYAANIVRPAHMSICVDYTEGAPANNNLSPFLHYRNPSVVLRMTADAYQHGTEPGQKKAMNREELFRWIEESCSVDDELINNRRMYPPMKAKRRALSSVVPKAVIELECAPKQMASVVNVSGVKLPEKNEREHRTVTTTETFEQQWRKMIDSDRRQLYSDVLNWSPMSQSEKRSTQASPRSPVPEYSTEPEMKDVGTVTDFKEKKDWGQPFGVVDFEPADNKGHVSKGVQARGEAEMDP